MSRDIVIAEQKITRKREPPQMKIRILRLAVSIALIVTTATAQNTFPATGNAGIGTATPAASLQIWGGDLEITGPNLNGTAHISSQAGVAFYGNNAYTNGIAINPAGQVGINNANPLFYLDVNGTIAIQDDPVIDETTIATPADGTYVIASGGRIHGEYAVSFEGPDRSQTVHLLANANQFDGASTLQIIDNHSYNAPATLSNFGLLMSANGITEYLVMNVANRNGGNAVHVRYLGSADYPNGGATFGGTLPGGAVPVGVTSLAINEGNLGIGTETPGAKPEVNGNMTFTRGSGAFVTFQDGSEQSVAWTGTLSGGDYAESVDVSGDRTKYELGDVLVIDPASPGMFLKSTTAYSTAVAGIYSTNPGVRGRRQKSDQSHMKDEVPMAMVGVVPTKVSAESGPIHPGDLLVTASRPGYAMKGADRTQVTGAIVGKAMGNLDSGTGVIEVLVSLQ